MAADALLAAAKQVVGIEPRMQRHLGTLKDRADRDRVLLAAGIAEIEAVTAPGDRGSALKGVAMRADRFPIRPLDCLQMASGGVWIGEAGGELFGHGFFLIPQRYATEL